MTSPKRSTTRAQRSATRAQRSPRWLIGAGALLALPACQRSNASQGSEAATPSALSPAASAAVTEVAAAPEPPLLAQQTPKAEKNSRLRAVPTDAARVYAKTRNVWIRGDASSANEWIGFLWIGNSVKLASPEPLTGPGCSGSWYAIVPRGYVCVDGERATLDANDPVVQGLFALSPNPQVANPHPFYGESRDAQVYHELPTEQTQRAREWDYRLQMQQIDEALSGSAVHPALEGVSLLPVKDTSLPLPELPRFLRLERKRLIPRSSVAWTREVRHEGRNFLLTDDFTWVPKDRVVPYQPVTFRGLWLGDIERAGELATAKLPLAFFRGRKNQKYLKNSDDSFSASEGTYPRLAWTSLTGEQLREDGGLYHETREGYWVHDDDAVVPRTPEMTPWGAPVFGKDDTGEAPGGRQTWVDVSILGGWLVAYEGTKPVFTTMISPGRGGPPHGKIPPLQTSSTPTGRFKITGKFVTATMAAPNDLVHSAVPWAQNFSGPFALHGAYWHNDWGTPKSGGCVNLSPADGRFMFAFSEPTVPEGWHGVRWVPKQEPATTLLVRR